MGVTRIFEKIEEGIRNQEAEMTGIKKKVFNWAQKQALHHHEQVSDICDTRVHMEELSLRSFYSLILYDMQKKYMKHI